MTLTLDDLLAGPKLPSKQVYIEALGDSIEIQPVALSRYREYEDASDEDKHEIMEMCIAESLSKQSDMTVEAAKELNKKIREQIHPAAYNEIAQAVAVTMMGDLGNV